MRELFEQVEFRSADDRNGTRAGRRWWCRHDSERPIRGGLKQSPASVVGRCRSVILEEEVHTPLMHDKAVEYLFTLFIVIDHRVGQVVCRRGDDKTAHRFAQPAPLTEIPAKAECVVKSKSVELSSEASIRWCYILKCYRRDFPRKGEGSESYQAF